MCLYPSDQHRAPVGASTITGHSCRRSANAGLSQSTNAVCEKSGLEDSGAQQRIWRLVIALAGGAASFAPGFFLTPSPLLNRGAWVAARRAVDRGNPALCI